MPMNNWHQLTAGKTMSTLTDSSPYIIGSDLSTKDLGKCTNVILVWSVMEFTSPKPTNRLGQGSPLTCRSDNLQARIYISWTWDIAFLALCRSPVSVASLHLSNQFMYHTTVSGNCLLFSCLFIFSPHGGEKRWRQKMKYKLEIDCGMYVLFWPSLFGQDNWILTSFIFCVFMDRHWVEVHKNAANELGL